MPIGRREFLQGSVAFLAESGLREIFPQTGRIVIGEFPVMGSEEEYFYSLRPNRGCTLTNYFDVPDSLVLHLPDEIVSCAVNFNPMFDRNSFGCLNLNKKGGDLWGRGRKIREAIDGNRQVFLTVELPKNNSIPVSEWSLYVKSLVGQYPASHFIIGNEINADFNKFWQKNPAIFAEYYLAASEVIKEKFPQSILLMYGEAYNQEGETLKKILEAMGQKNSLQTVDGLAFHFYDLASKLPARTEMYGDIANDFGLPPKLFLTELGKPETSSLSLDEQSSCVVQNLSVALALASKKEIETVIWHTAHQVGDPNRHSLSKYDSVGIPCQIKPAFLAFNQVVRLLYRNIVLRNEGENLVVQGETSLGDKVVITWKKGENTLNEAIEGNPGAVIYT